ncbi:MAG: DMT family transporter [Candidatus Levybacteria bacterium]|nr:DMT family transporter [Candidatus Levybacteria bacterium]
MRLSKPQLAILALIVTNIIWGASSPIFKWSLEEVSPFTFAFVRFFLAALLLLPFTIHKLVISKHDFVSLFVLAFIGFFVHIGLLLFGLTISSSVNASVIATAAPIFLLIGSLFIFREKVKKRIILGTIISLLGVIIIILRPLFDHGLDGTITGNLLFLLSTISFVLYTFMLKNYTTHLKASTVTFYLFMFTAVIFLPFFLVESSHQPLTSIVSLQAILGILFGAIFTSVIGYMFYNFAIHAIKTSEIGLFLYVDPVITVLIAVPLLGEHITPSFIIGSIAVILGICIAEKRIHYHPIHRLFKKHPL